MNERDPVQEVPGERDTNSLARILSTQSRVSNILAMALVSVLGLGSLAWYYTSAMTRSGRARSNEQRAAVQRAQGEMPLPSLGRIEPPSPTPAAEMLPDIVADRSPPAAQALAEVPLAPYSPAASSSASAPTPPPSPKTAAELALERKLSGGVYSPRGGAPGSVIAAPALPVTTAMVSSESTSGVTAFSNAGSAPATGPATSDLTTLLRPSSTPAVRAHMLPAQRLLLPKGAFIDCTLETAIDSTLPGMTTCIAATDTFGVDGKVVLLERGTKLVGETRGQVQQGTARLFVLWTEARTPRGVVVPLDSPGVDELGRAGLPGSVNRHFWQRFGAAILVSIIDGAVQSAARSRGGGAVIVNPSASQDVLTEILKNTISIPPTVVKRNGDRIQVLVARDLDFRSVYELQSVASDR